MDFKKIIALFTVPVLAITMFASLTEASNTVTASGTITIQGFPAVHDNVVVKTGNGSYSNHISIGNKTFGPNNTSEVFRIYIKNQGSNPTGELHYGIKATGIDSDEETTIAQNINIKIEEYGPPIVYTHYNDSLAGLQNGIGDGFIYVYPNINESLMYIQITLTANQLYNSQTLTYNLEFFQK